MAEKITLKNALANLPQKTDVDSIVAKDASGNPVFIKKSDLAQVVAELMPENALLSKLDDGVFIMHHRRSDDYPLIVKPHKWTSLQNSGEIADGVAIVEGGKILVVAPTQATTKLTWSSGDVSGGGTTTWDRVAALNDWNGKTNTHKQIAASKEGAVTNTASYAPGFCNLYSRSNANGKGLTAGKWWLPSLGEMMMIYANMTKVNYALSLISGATQLVEDAYWTSTEASAADAWYLYLSNGFAGNYTKVSFQRYVRAVSAFIS